MSAPIVQKEAEALAADAVRACAHGADADAQGRPPRLLIRQLNIEMFMQHTSPSDL